MATLGRDACAAVAPTNVVALEGAGFVEDGAGEGAGEVGTLGVVLAARESSLGGLPAGDGSAQRPLRVAGPSLGRRASQATSSVVDRVGWVDSMG